MDGAATAAVQDVVQVGWSEARRNARLGDTAVPDSEHTPTDDVDEKEPAG